MASPVSDRVILYFLSLHRIHPILLLTLICFSKFLLNFTIVLNFNYIIHIFRLNRRKAVRMAVYRYGTGACGPRMRGRNVCFLIRILSMIMDWAPRGAMHSFGPRILL